MCAASQETFVLSNLIYSFFAVRHCSYQIQDLTYVLTNRDCYYPLLFTLEHGHVENVSIYSSFLNSFLRVTIETQEI